MGGHWRVRDGKGMEKNGKGMRQGQGSPETDTGKTPGSARRECLFAYEQKQRAMQTRAGSKGLSEVEVRNCLLFRDPTSHPGIGYSERWHCFMSYLSGDHTETQGI